MLIPRQNTNTFGAVHIDNYLDFIGFCKHVNNDYVCSVDIFFDDVKIDTLICDQSNQKLEEIYEISGHCFYYELDEKYCDKRHKISFKSSEDEIELFNSPIGTMAKDEEVYKEYKKSKKQITILQKRLSSKKGINE